MTASRGTTVSSTRSGRTACWPSGSTRARSASGRRRVDGPGPGRDGDAGAVRPHRARPGEPVPAAPTAASRSGSGRSGSRVGRRVADLDIEAPFGTTVVVETASGDVIVDGLTGDQRYRTRVGRSRPARGQRPADHRRASRATWTSRPPGRCVDRGPDGVGRPVGPGRCRIAVGAARDHERRDPPGGPVRRAGAVLGRDGQWRHDPRPDGRPSAGGQDRDRRRQFRHRGHLGRLAAGRGRSSSGEGGSTVDVPLDLRRRPGRRARRAGPAAEVAARSPERHRPRPNRPSPPEPPNRRMRPRGTPTEPDPIGQHRTRRWPSSRRSSAARSMSPRRPDVWPPSTRPATRESRHDATTRSQQVLQLVADGRLTRRRGRADPRCPRTGRHGRPTARTRPTRVRVFRGVEGVLRRLPGACDPDRGQRVGAPGGEPARPARPRSRGPRPHPGPVRVADGPGPRGDGVRDQGRHRRRRRRAATASGSSSSRGDTCDDRDAATVCRPSRTGSAAA